jgi:hypothetical protein
LRQQRPKRENIVVEEKGACFKRIGMTMVRIEKMRRRRRSIGRILPKLQDRVYPILGNDEGSKEPP